MQKEKRFPTTLSLFLFFLKGCKGLFAMGVACSVLVAFLDMIIPEGASFCCCNDNYIYSIRVCGFQIF